MLHAAPRRFALPALVAGAIALSVVPARASVILVPGDRPTIQQGINAANAGDTVLVAPGTYREMIDFIGKAIVVTSAAGPASTVIDANDSGSVVRIVSGETASSVLSGFLLRNGSGGSGGAGGISVINSSPTIRGNVIRDCSGDAGGILLSNSDGRVEGNTVDHNQGSGVAIGAGSPVVVGNTITDNIAGSGGGVSCGASSALIQRNRIRGNTAQFGGGLYIIGAASARIEENLIENNVSGSGAGIALFAAGTPTIRNNVIRGNGGAAGGPAGQGGGIWIVNASDAFIVQNLFVANRAVDGAGIYWLVPSSGRGPRALNNTFALNTASHGSAIFADGFDANAEIISNVMVAPANQTAFYAGDFNDRNVPSFRSNDVFTAAGPAYGGISPDMTGVNGNLSADPSFREPSRNFRLGAGSVCLDAGDTTATDLPATDLDGQPRLFDANGDGNVRVDMGAYEFSTTNLPPVADAGGPYSGDVDTPFDFDGTRSLDPDEDELTYVWDFGDGDGGIGARVSHQYLHVGTFRVILTVSDDTHSASDTTVAEALSLNKPPVAVAGGPYNGAVGQPVQFDGLGSHDPEGDSLSFHWSFGDGFTEDGPTPTHTYAFANVFNVQLEVRDATGAGRDSTTATISSATANLFASQGHAPDPVVAGGTLTYSIAVGNRGAFAAADAGMSFSAFGSRISITSVTTSRGSCASDSGGCCVSCAFGTLAPNDSARVQIALVPADEGFLNSTVSASSPTPDADYSDNNSFATVQIVFSAERRIANLIAILQSYSLHHGAEKKLVSRLDAARAALASHDSSGACADLDAFRQQVGKLSGHALTLAQALALDRGAGEIQQRLGCSQAGFALTAAARVPTEFAFRLRSSPAVTAEAQVDLPAAGPIRVDVFDINGRLVRTAFDAPLAPGTHSIAWDGRAAEGGRAPVGVYFLRVVSGREVAVARFVLLR